MNADKAAEELLKFQAIKQRAKPIPVKAQSSRGPIQALKKDDPVKKPANKDPIKSSRVVSKTREKVVPVAAPETKPKPAATQETLDADIINIELDKVDGKEKDAAATKQESG